MTKPTQFIIVLMFSFLSAVAQKKIKTVTVSDEIAFATVDRPGDLYVVTKNGQIQKFDVDGKLLSIYRNDPTPTLFDPRDGSRLFMYFRHDQHYAFLNPSFEVTASYKLDPAFAIKPWLTCISGDHNLWIVDGEDTSIKKIDINTSAVSVEQKIGNGVDDISTILFIREYQGFLFLLHQEKGIMIFNGIGKLLKTIEIEGLSYFNFIGEELYYSEDNSIKFFNLFTTEIRVIKANQPGDFILFTDERMFSIKDATIDFFELKR